MYQLVFVIHIIAAACLIALVLVQQGKGATVGAAFGSGASQTVFGSRGSGSFLFRVSMGFMVIFFSTSIGLNYMASKSVREQAQLMLPSETKANKIPALPPVAPKSEPIGPGSIPGVMPSSVPLTLPIDNKK